MLPISMHRRGSHSEWVIPSSCNRIVLVNSRNKLLLDWNSNWMLDEGIEWKAVQLIGNGMTCKLLVVELAWLKVGQMVTRHNESDIPVSCFAEFWIAGAEWPSGRPVESWIYAEFVSEPDSNDDIVKRVESTPELTIRPANRSEQPAKVISTLKAWPGHHNTTPKSSSVWNPNGKHIIWMKWDFHHRRINIACLTLRRKTFNVAAEGKFERKTRRLLRSCCHPKWNRARRNRIEFAFKIKHFHKIFQRWKHSYRFCIG